MPSLGRTRLGVAGPMANYAGFVAKEAPAVADGPHAMTGLSGESGGTFGETTIWPGWFWGTWLWVVISKTVKYLTHAI